MVLRRSIHVNGLLSQICESALVDIWTRLKPRICALPEGAGREQAWLAGKLGVNIQIVNNWLQREKIPPGRYEEIAAAVDWSVDELLGKPALAPSRGFLRRDLEERLRYLSERDIGRLEHIIEQELDRTAAHVRSPIPAPVQTSSKLAERNTFADPVAQMKATLKARAPAPAVRLSTSVKKRGAA